MSRRNALSAAGGIVLLVLSAGCKVNHPPATPQLSGPTLGEPSATLIYTFSSSDPEDQEVAYSVAWGDASAPVWTADCPSGQQVTSSHAYSDAGVYRVKVKARDTRLAESEWSDSVVVSIGFLPPAQPGMPSGPVACTVGLAGTFKVTTSDPFDDSLWFQFDWGDRIGSWGGPVAHDSVFREEHAFDSAGTFGVKARAKDAHGGASPWSEPLAVTVTAVPPGAPDVSCEAVDTGAALRLSWSAVPDAESYEIQADDSVHATTSLSFDVAVPAATVKVRAVGAHGRSDPATIDCRVVETEALEVYGMSDPDTSRHAGFAFNPDGTITTYTLAYWNQPLLDFYADDVAYHGHMYLVNPGDKGWNGKGNAGKAAASSVYDEVRIADGSGYMTQFEIRPDSVYHVWLDRTNNGWDAEDNFAKARVTSISGTLVIMRVGYQRIPGLRWLVN